MTYPTLTDAATAFGIDQATLVEQMRRLERDVGATLFHRATPASQPQHPTQRGSDLLQTLAAHGIHGQSPNPPTPKDLPPDLLRTVQGQQSGWTRLERFATTMNHPTINAAAAAIGINRATLIEQLHRLETDVGAPLYHRATSDGQPQAPTSRAHGLLAILNRGDVQALRTQRTRLPRLTAPRTSRKRRHQDTTNPVDNHPHAFSAQDSDGERQAL